MPVRCPRQNPALADMSSYKWGHFTDSVPAVACPPLAGFLASLEFPVLRSIISSLDFSTLSSPHEPRFHLDSQAPHVSFCLLPEWLLSRSHRLGISSTHAWLLEACEFCCSDSFDGSFVVPWRQQARRIARFRGNDSLNGLLVWGWSLTRCLGDW